jgi:hypothetical protein
MTLHLDLRPLLRDVEGVGTREASKCPFQIWEPSRFGTSEPDESRDPTRKFQIMSMSSDDTSCELNQSWITLIFLQELRVAHNNQSAQCTVHYNDSLRTKACKIFIKLLFSLFYYFRDRRSQISTPPPSSFQKTHLTTYVYLNQPLAIAIVLPKKSSIN